MTDSAADPASAESLAARPVPVGVGAVESTRWRQAVAALIGLLAVVALVAIGIAWRASQRVGSLEQELVRRQLDSAGQADEARRVAREAQDGVRDASAKVALLEARVAEVSVQRTQLDDLIQSLSRSRDENLLGDIESAIRVASQQVLITGSAEPLVAALKQSDERLTRRSEPRLDGVRRAVVRDLDRLKAVGVNDIPSLAIKLDEAIRLVDELPLLASADAHAANATAPGAARLAPAAPDPPASASRGAALFASWTDTAGEWWGVVAGRIGAELRSLVRVTRIDHPEAMLLAPDQGFFLRENLKLRLLNARLALISRQFDGAQSDLTVARTAIERYFDRDSRRTVAALGQLRQIGVQLRQVSVPRPDDTLAALAAATATAGR